jgi:hypothetical protein
MITGSASCVGSAADSSVPNYFLGVHRSCVSLRIKCHSRRHFFCNGCSFTHDPPRQPDLHTCTPQSPLHRGDRHVEFACDDAPSEPDAPRGDDADDLVLRDEAPADAGAARRAEAQPVAGAAARVSRDRGAADLARVSLHGCACWRPARGMPEWRPAGEKAIRAECPNTFFLKGSVVIRTGALYEWRTNSGDPIRTAHDGLRTWFTCNPGMHSRRTGSSYFSLKRTFDFIQRLITSRHSFSVF